MRNLMKNSPANIMVLVTDSSDHITGKTGISLSGMISKNGAAFTALSSSISERAYGWYCISLDADDTDVNGDLVIHVEATGADPADVLCRVGTVPAIIQEVASAAAKYQAKVWLIRGSASDGYQCIWFKDGQPIEAGVSSPMIRVVDSVAGNHLFGPVAMMQIPGMHAFKLMASTRIEKGSAYTVIVQATIDGATRTWMQPMGYSV